MFDKICTHRGEIDAPIQQILSFGVMSDADFHPSAHAVQQSSDADFYPYTQSTASMILRV